MISALIGVVSERCLFVGFLDHIEVGSALDA